MLIKFDDKGGGIVLDVENKKAEHVDVVYACVTAPVLTYVEIIVDGVVFDGVHVSPGSSHSWWTNAGGKLLPVNGLPPKSRLIIKSSGPCAFRLDWI